MGRWPQAGGPVSPSRVWRLLAKGRFCTGRWWVSRGYVCARLPRQEATASRSHGQDWLKSNSSQSLRVDDLAGHAGVSISTFHHHLRELTAMSPLQYTKWLRFNEARQLMTTKRLEPRQRRSRSGTRALPSSASSAVACSGASPARDVSNWGGKALRGEHRVDVHLVPGWDAIRMSSVDCERNHRDYSLNRYPTPISVWRCRGRVGSGSIFWRSLWTWIRT